MYGGSGVSPVRLARRAAARQRPSPRCSSSSTGAEALPGAAAGASAARAPPRRRSPRAARAAAPRRLAAARSRIRAGTTRVSFTTTSSPASSSGSSAKRAVAHLAGRALVDEQPRGVAARRRVLRDQLRRQLVVELVRVHPTASVALAPMDAGALERAKAAHRRSRGRADGAGRARGRARALARADRGARGDGGRARERRCRSGSARPSRTACARRSCRSRGNLAEIRGLLNQAIRRLERLEGDLLAERHARIDDLALLVDLVSSGWRASTTGWSGSSGSRTPTPRFTRPAPRKPGFEGDRALGPRAAP